MYRSIKTAKSVSGFGDSESCQVNVTVLLKEIIGKMSKELFVELVSRLEETVIGVADHS